MTTQIRRARPGDEAELTAMVHELAEFEHAAEQCTVTEKQLTAALFGDQPSAWAHIAEVDGTARRDARCGIAPSRRGTAWRASTWRTCSCAPSSGDTVWRADCWPPWPASARRRVTRD